MPTPLEILLDPISLGALTLYAVLMLWEAVAPARQLPKVSGWIPRAVGTFVTYFYLSSYLPLFWDGYLAQYQLFDLSHLGILGGAAVGVLVYTGLVYGWHRAMHENSMLFRSFHQMHHSAERLDSFGALYFSPLDMIGFTFIGSLSLSVVVGISPSAVTVFFFSTFFMAIFQHLNVKTPRWVGVFIQRPESHAIHHGRGLHYYNFSDFPVFDMLFGTFRNPADFEMESGFYHGASARIIDMLLFRDVSTEPEPELQIDALIASPKN